MKIKIDGSLCVSCKSYRQYYGQEWQGSYEPIDAGYCWKQHVVVRPGDYCKAYTEKPNVGTAAKVALAARTGKEQETVKA